MKKQISCSCIAAGVAACLLTVTVAGAQTATGDRDSTSASTAKLVSEHAKSVDFTRLYAFEAPAARTFKSRLGSQPDTLPVVGSDGAIYGMTSVGGEYGNGVIYRYDPTLHQYKVLHIFGALDANGENADGATPGMAVTRGAGDLMYGMASYGGQNGTGTVFEFTPSGELTVLHTFSALDATGHNQDGAYPLRAIALGNDGNIYGTTRLGGPNTCLFTHGCGVAWTIDGKGNFAVVHSFTADEGHAASMLQGMDGYFYGCAVWPATSLPPGPLPSGILYRMAPSGQDFQVLYTFSQTDASGDNMDGADCYEPLVEVRPGVFYGSAARGGSNGEGVIFRYSLSNPGTVEVVHDFSALNSAGQNWDGAVPVGRLALGPHGIIYSNAESGGANGNGVVFSIREDGRFKVVHTFSATNAKTGANQDGALPDEGLIVNENGIIGIAIYGGNGSPAGYNNSGGTLYELTLDDNHYW